MKIVPVIAILTLAACAGEADAPSGNADSASSSEPSKHEMSAPAKRVQVQENTNRYEFAYSYPAEAASIPALDEILRAQQAKTKAELVETAKREDQFRKEQGLEYHPLFSKTEISLAGESEWLLVLDRQYGAYTGGAHGIQGRSVLLWDRQQNKEISTADLFGGVAGRDAALKEGWCLLIEQARRQKRTGPAMEGSFDECPSLDEISIIPFDDDGNKRFERLHLVADPYVAGPYAEGFYEIEMRLSPRVVSAIDPAYRAAFEAVTQ